MAAHTDKVTRLAHLVPLIQPRHVIVPQLAPGVYDLRHRLVSEPLVDLRTVDAAVQVVDFDELVSPSGQLLIPDRVDL